MSRDRKAPARAPRTVTEAPAPGLFGRYPTAAALVFLALSLLVFFAPMVFSGKVFLPPDNIASMSHRPFLEEVKAGGEYPLWTPYLFSGMPSLGSLIAAPGTNPFSTALAWLGPQLKPVAWYFLVGLFTFLLARRRVTSRFAALFAAVSFVYCAHVIGWVMAGHNSKLATTIFLPAILLLVDRLLEKPGPLNAGLAALAIGLSIVTSHLQITYYTMLAAGLLLLVLSVARLRSGMKPATIVAAWALFGAAIVIGLGASAIVSLPVREYAHWSIRGAEGAGLTRDYATNWSLHPAEALTFFVPAFFGFGGPTYWGWMPFTDAPQYMGILPLFLAVAGAVLTWKRAATKFFVILALLALVVSFGKELPILYDPFFQFLPFFNKFRVPSMILVLTQLAVAVLAAFAIDALAEPVPEAERQRRAGLFRKTLFAFGGVFLLVGLVTLLGRGSLVSAASTKLAPGAAVAAAGLAARDFLLVFVFFAVGAGALWMWTNRALARTVAFPLLLVVTLADLWIVGQKTAHYQEPGNSTGVFQPTGTIEFLKRDTDPFRVMPLNAPLAPSPNWWAYFKIENAHGYHPAKLKVYQDLIDENGPVGLGKQLQRGNFNLLRAANVRYLVIGQAGLGGADLTPVNEARGTGPGGQPAVEYTYRLSGPLERAQFVDRYRVLSGPDAALEAMADPRWRPAEEVLLLEEPGVAIEPSAGASVRMTDRRPHHRAFEVTATGTNLLYVSEIWYPGGWTAKLDGQPVDVLRANYAFRAVVIPPGTHTLTFDFRDPAFEQGRTISLASYGLIGLAILAGVLLERRRRGAPAPA
jgi:hypothetical protein